MAQVGDSSGARSNPQIDWAMNLKDGIDKAEQAYKMPCYFTRVWIRLLKFLAQVVLGNINSRITKLGGLTLDAGMASKEDGILRYSVEIDGKSYSFETSEKSLLSGAVTRNYTKYIF